MAPRTAVTDLINVARVPLSHYLWWFAFSYEAGVWIVACGLNDNFSQRSSALAVFG